MSIALNPDDRVVSVSNFDGRQVVGSESILQPTLGGATSRVGEVRAIARRHILQIRASACDGIVRRLFLEVFSASIAHDALAVAGILSQLIKP